MPGQVSDGSREWASRVVRRFCAATNLLIAGRRVEVRGDGPHAEALGRLLVSIGALRARAGEHGDYVFAVGPLGDLPSATGHPVIVVETEDAHTATVRQLRTGVYSTAVDNVVLVRVAEAPEPGVPLGSAVARLDWAARFMSVSAAIAAELADSGLARGVRIGVSMVLEPKTAVLALQLQDAGALVSVFAHPDETDDEIAHVLRDRGVPVFAHRGASRQEHLDLALAFLDQGLQVLVDDGSHVLRLAHVARPQVLEQLIGATEETTSGLTPLRIMEAQGLLRVPVVAVNDARSKTFFDNRYGTGQSCVFTTLDLLDLDAGGRTVVVAGFGHVGEGVAHHARALGADVIVSEIDPGRALQAEFAGFAVAPLVEAVRAADLVISATGVPNTLSREVLEACADGAAISVAGGADQEVAVDAVVAAGASRVTVGHRVECIRLATGTDILLLDGGGCINVTAGEGNPIEIMDLSFAVQLSAIRSLLEPGVALEPGVHPLARSLDDRVAELALGGAFSPATATSQVAGSWQTSRFGAITTESSSVHPGASA